MFLFFNYYGIITLGEEGWQKKKISKKKIMTTMRFQN